MAKTTAARAAPATALVVRRTAGAESDRRVAKTAVSTTPPILTPEDFRMIGETLNGTHWQADIAKLLGCSKSQVTRYLNKSRGLTPLVAHQMRDIIAERIADLALMLRVQGMPAAAEPETDAAVKAIRRAAETLRHPQA